MRLHQILEKYIPLVSNMLFPLLVFSVGLLAFLISGGFAYDSAKILHWCFYLISFISLVTLLNFNQSRSLFLMAIILLSYVIINYLKKRLGIDFKTSILYQNLAMLLPFNFLFFYIFPKHRFISRQSLVLLFLILIEYSFCEFAIRWNLVLDIMWNNIGVISAIGAFILIITALFNSIKKGDLFDYTVLFSFLSVMSGFYFSNSSSGISLFFFFAQFLLSAYLIYTLVYNHYYDENTGFYSRNSYLIQSKHFPLKYRLGIVSIDNYDKLLKTVGSRKQKIINELIADVIQSMAPEEVIYRYAADQFIILYKRFDKKEAFKHIEEIRREIAGVEFEYSPTQKAIKLTVSCSIAEKKRSDIDAVEVLMRADKAMRKTLKFSHNVTSQG